MKHNYDSRLGVILFQCRYCKSFLHRKVAANIHLSYSYYNSDSFPSTIMVAR